MDRDFFARPFRPVLREFDVPHPRRVDQHSSAPITPGVSGGYGGYGEPSSPITKPGGKTAKFPGSDSTDCYGMVVVSRRK